MEEIMIVRMKEKVGREKERKREKGRVKDFPRKWKKENRWRGKVFEKKMRIK